jgi:chromosome segregation ATPase
VTALRSQVGELTQANCALATQLREVTTFQERTRSIAGSDEDADRSLTDELATLKSQVTDLAAANSVLKRQLSEQDSKFGERVAKSEEHSEPSDENAALKSQVAELTETNSALTLQLAELGTQHRGLSDELAAFRRSIKFTIFHSEYHRT